MSRPQQAALPAVYANVKPSETTGPAYSQPGVKGKWPFLKHLNTTVRSLKSEEKKTNSDGKEST